MSRRTILMACALLSACATSNSTAHGPEAHDPKASSPPALGAASTLPCQGSTDRGYHPQGTLLWGTERQDDNQEMSSVMSSLELGDIQLEGGRLTASVGTRFQGTASNGARVEAALCGSEPQNDGSGLVWYRIELRRAGTTAWVNPCVATDAVPEPRALAVAGVWNARGGHEARPGRFTFACENGVIAKCADWGYAPWATKDGQSLAKLHQACTRMARADYCGDGRSHTLDETIIDMYDVLDVQTRTLTSSTRWDLSKAAFEAAWMPDGSTCLSQTRDGKSLPEILQECPGRFELKAKDIGGGDQCMATRRGVDPSTALLRNHSYTKNPQVGMRGTAP